MRSAAPMTFGGGCATRPDMSLELEAFGLSIEDFTAVEVVDLIARRLPCAEAEALRRSNLARVAAASESQNADPEDRIQIGPLDV